MPDKWSQKISRILFATPAPRDKLNMRVWFAIFCTFLTAAAMISQWGFERYADGGEAWARGIWLLGLYVFYFALASTYIPLPTAWFVLFLASPCDGVTCLPEYWRIFAVAGIGALASAVSHANEYHVIAYLMRLGRIGQLKKTKTYLWAKKQFEISPFGMQIFLNIAPLPADPSRWLASMSGYPLNNFFAAQWIGRFIRYSFLAVAAVYFQFSLREIALIQIGLFGIAIAGFIIKKIHQKQRQPNGQIMVESNE